MTRHSRPPALQHASPHNARKEILRDDAFAELKASIRENGLLQPVVVRQDGPRHMLIAGHRRLEAVRELAAESPADPCWRKILAIERDVDERTAEGLSLVENLQRQDLDPVDEAQAYVRLRDTYGLSLGAIADLVHKSKMHVSRRVRLAGDSALQEAVRAGQLAVSTAERLLRAPERMRADLTRQAVAERWTPEQVEDVLRSLPAVPPAITASAVAARSDFSALLRRLRVDVPVLERERGRVADAERAELATWGQRLLSVVKP